MRNYVRKANKKYLDSGKHASLYLMYHCAVWWDSGRLFHDATTGCCALPPGNPSDRCPAPAWARV